jgi:membrane protease YdiL (CAAX protease family)
MGDAGLTICRRKLPPVLPIDSLSQPGGGAAPRNRHSGRMRWKLRDDLGRLRNGWKALFFLLAASGAFVAVGLVGRLLPAEAKVFAPSALMVAAAGLLLTWAAVRLEGCSLGSVGLRFGPGFNRQLAIGVLAGALLVAVSAGLVSGLAGVSLVRTDPPAVSAQAKVVVVMLGGAVFEELLFRGYAFQRAVRGLGAWSAIAVFSLLFCLAHLPGNLELGAGMFAVVMAGLCLDAIIQSLIFLRTGSLALPIGLHFAWNLVQQALGFGVSGTSVSTAWFRPELGSLPGWLTGGAYGLEASVFGLAVQVAVLAALAGTARAGVAGGQAAVSPGAAPSH